MRDRDWNGFPPGSSQARYPLPQGNQPGSAYDGIENRSPIAGPGNNQDSRPRTGAIRRRPVPGQVVSQQQTRADAIQATAEIVRPEPYHHPPPPVSLWPTHDGPISRAPSAFDSLSVFEEPQEELLIDLSASDTEGPRVSLEEHPEIERKTKRNCKNKKKKTKKAESNDFWNSMFAHRIPIARPPCATTEHNPIPSSGENPTLQENNNGLLIREMHSDQEMAWRLAREFSLLDVDDPSDIPCVSYIFHPRDRIARLTKPNHLQSHLPRTNGRRTWASLTEICDAQRPPIPRTRRAR